MQALTWIAAFWGTGLVGVALGLFLAALLGRRAPGGRGSRLHAGRELQHPGLGRGRHDQGPLGSLGRHPFDGT
jgi:hypothetical protein